MHRTKTCRQAAMLTVDGATVYFNGFTYSLVARKSKYAQDEPAVSTAYHEDCWNSIKQKRAIKAEGQLGVKVQWVEIESREVGYAAI